MYISQYFNACTLRVCVRRNDFQEAPTTRTPLINSPQSAYCTLQYQNILFIPSTIMVTEVFPLKSPPDKKRKGGRPNNLRGQRKSKFKRLPNAAYYIKARMQGSPLPPSKIVMRKRLQGQGQSRPLLSHPIRSSMRNRPKPQLMCFSKKIAPTP